ncbi:MAG: hypothetical protein ACOYN3_06570 [Acidimicrobiia bacterium]
MNAHDQTQSSGARFRARLEQHANSERSVGPIGLSVIGFHHRAIDDLAEQGHVQVLNGVENADP